MPGSDPELEEEGGGGAHIAGVVWLFGAHIFFLRVVFFCFFVCFCTRITYSVVGGSGGMLQGKFFYESASEAIGPP